MSIYKIIDEKTMTMKMVNDRDVKASIKDLIKLFENEDISEREFENFVKPLLSLYLGEKIRKKSLYNNYFKRINSLFHYSGV